MPAYRLSINAMSTNACGGIGGQPALPVGSLWPTCKRCDQPLVAYIDLVLPKEKSAPFKSGSRLQVFACREHDDIAGTIYSDYARFDEVAQTKKLPKSYWELNDGHYLLRLLPPGEEVTLAMEENRLDKRFLHADPWQEQPYQDLKLFGEPDWIQDAEEHTCACGQPMTLLLQIPDGFGFDMAGGAPEQPNSFSKSQYCLFLGNQMYLFGCAAQCHPLALWPVLQN